MDMDSCATTGFRRQATTIARYPRSMLPAWITRARTCTRKALWIRTTASMSMQGRPAPGAPCSMRDGKNTSTWTIRFAPAHLCPARCSAPTAPMTRTCLTRNSWNCQAATSPASSLPPGMSTTLTGTKRTPLQKNYFWSPWSFFNLTRNNLTRVTT